MFGLLDPNHGLDSKSKGKKNQDFEYKNRIKVLINCLFCTIESIGLTLPIFEGEWIESRYLLVLFFRLDR